MVTREICLLWGKRRGGHEYGGTGTNTGDRSGDGFGKCQMIFYSFLVDAKIYLLVTDKE